MGFSVRVRPALALRPWTSSLTLPAVRAEPTKTSRSVQAVDDDAERGCAEATHDAMRAASALRSLGASCGC